MYNLNSCGAAVNVALQGENMGTNYKSIYLLSTANFPATDSIDSTSLPAALPSMKLNWY